jgi:hypothetical protein
MQFDLCSAWGEGEAAEQRGKREAEREAQTEQRARDEAI